MTRERSSALLLSKLLAACVWLTVSVFFVLEMLLKPISGEDAFQQSCMAGSWSHLRECGEWVLDFIPRLGQVVHYLIIWQFSSVPSFGLETVFRLSSALLSIFIIWMMVLIVLGRRPRLRLQDAGIAALAFALLVLSDISQVFFNGFSNVHNYVPIMSGLLVAVYSVISFDRMVVALGRPLAYAAVVVAFFTVTAGFDTNALVVAVALVILAVTRWKSSPGAGTWNVQVPWVTAIAGSVLGTWFFWILGNGWGSVTRPGAFAHHSGVDLESGLVHISVSLMGNMASHVAFYFPLVIVALISVLVAIYDSRISPQGARTLIVTTVTGLLSLLALAPAGRIDGRVSALAYMLLCIPLLAMCLHLVKQVVPRVNARVPAIAMTLASLLLAGMTIDNTRLLVHNVQSARAAFETISEVSCVDRQIANLEAFRLESSLFSITRDEHSFSYVFSSWYGPSLNVNGQPVPIQEICP